MVTRLTIAIILLITLLPLETQIAQADFQSRHKFGNWNQDKWRVEPLAAEPVANLVRPVPSFPTIAPPERINAKPVLNEHNLYGNVKSSAWHTYANVQIPSDGFDPKDQIAYVKHEFTTAGLSKSQTSHRLDPKISTEPLDTTFIEYTGTYYKENLTIYRSSPDDLRKEVTSTISVERTDSEVREFAQRGSGRQLINTSKLTNGRIVETTQDLDSQPFTVRQEYGPHGFVISMEILSTENKPQKQYYQYLSFDEHGNWTKRVVFGQPEYLSPLFVQTQTLTYH